MSIYVEFLEGRCTAIDAASRSCSFSFDKEKPSMRSFATLPSFREKSLSAVIGIAAASGLLICAQMNPARLLARGTQTAEAPLPSFEVVSIKLDKSRLPLGGIHLFGDRFNATNSALGLIQWAYGHNGIPRNPNEVSGGPEWAKSQLFDVDAKLPDSLLEGAGKKLSDDQRWNQLMLMLQSMLADRFSLRLRHQTKELPVYALVLAKNGPKFTEDDSHTENQGIAARGRGKFQVTSDSLDIFVSILSRMPELDGRVVLNKTGLQGRYSFLFEFTPENLASRPGHPADTAPSPESSAPSLFTALSEELGLKLESVKAPVDILVIDRIEHPSEN
jgi:uncharacterized protein (TIGR03435 family)